MPNSRRDHFTENEKFWKMDEKHRSEEKEFRTLYAQVLIFSKQNKIFRVILKTNPKNVMELNYEERGYAFIMLWTSLFLLYFSLVCVLALCCPACTAGNSGYILARCR